MDGRKKILNSTNSFHLASTTFSAASPGRYYLVSPASERLERARILFSKILALHARAV
jgi:hypothetical protein